MRLIKNPEIGTNRRVMKAKWIIKKQELSEEPVYDQMVINKMKEKHKLRRMKKELIQNLDDLKWKRKSKKERKAIDI